MNAKTELLQNSLPLICAGLGDKLNVKIKVQGNQAETDGRTIVIPDFKISSREDKDAVLGYASHEAAHIKFNSWKGLTDADFQCSALRKAMWNIFEDLRIESEMIKSMIGTKKWINQIWINRQKEGSRPAVTSDSEPTSIMADYLLFTCRVKYRKQTHLQPYLDAATNAFIDKLGWKLQMQLDDVLNKHLPKLTSSRKAFDLAIQVDQLINNHDPEEPQEPEPKQEQSSQGEDEEGEQQENSAGGDSGEDNPSEDEGANSNSSESEGEGDSSTGEPQSGESGAESNTETESSSNSESNAESGEEETQTTPSGQPSSSAPNTPTAEDIKRAIEALAQATDEDFEDDMEQFTAQMAKLAQANVSQSHVSIPEVQYAKDVVGNNSFINQFGKKLTSEVKRNSTMLTAKLQGLVQEDMRVRCRTKDSGQRINTKVIHRLAVGNSKVFKTKAKKREIDTIVEVMIDNSGSMTNRRTSKGETLISEARKAQLSLAFALDKLEGVSVTASAFPTAHKDSTQVIELLSEGESVKKLAKRMSVVCGTADNTPSASAMWHSIRKVVESQKQRKIILFVTDGDPNPDQAESLKHLVTKAEKNGIVVIGIAIGPIATNKSRFYRHFSNAIFIQDAAELKTEMFKVAQNLISG